MPSRGCSWEAVDMMNSKPGADANPVQGHAEWSILRAVGENALRDIVAEYLQLLDTSSAIYERNGECAYRTFSSAWCRMFEDFSQETSGILDPDLASGSGPTKCPHSCWTHAYRPAIESGKPVEGICDAGLRLYAVPIRACGKVVGSIGFSLGDPPSHPEDPMRISHLWGVELEELRRRAEAYQGRSSFIIRLAKQRLHASARLIGTMVERKQAEQALAARIRYEEGLSACSRALLQDHENSLTEAMGHLLKAADVSRIYIFENFEDPRDGLCCRQTLEVCAPGIEPQIGNPLLQYQPFKNGFLRWPQILSRGEPISGLVETFPQSEQDILVPQGILSLLVLPIRVGSRWFGFIGFDDTLIPRRWQDRDISLLQTGAELIGSYLERKQTEEALRRSEYEKSLILNSMSELFVHYDLDMNLLWANRAVSDSLGLDLKTISKRRCHELWHGSDTPCPQCPVIKARNTGEPHEEEITTADGRVWLVRGYPVLDAKGDVVSMTEFAKDITARKRAEAGRITLERRLLHAQKLESLGVLAGGIAHDFNNLLMAIHGNLDLALLDLPDDSDVRPVIERAMAASRRAADLTHQMLAYSGKGHFMLSRLDLSRLVHENAILLRASFPRTVTLRLDTPSGLPPIRADAGQIQQIVMNLITNAYEAIGTNSGEVTLTTGVQDCDEACLSRNRVEESPEPGRFVFMEVSDTGRGMDSETLGRLFDPFFTTKFAGRGLGMSAVLGIVRGHKGAIFVESTPGVGTKIRVLFPVIQAEPSTEAVRPSSTEFLQTARSGTILVVDDEEIVRHLCKEFVQHLGFQAVEAANGLEAMHIFRSHHRELCCVILDLNMPHRDGVNTFAEMRRINSQVPVILCSGYTEEEATRRFTGKGLAGFIQKPYRFQTLKELLDHVLASR